MSKPFFYCPDCRGDLSLQDNAYFCLRCSSRWPVKQGIPVFIKNELPYWAEIPKAEAIRFNILAQDLGWREAMRKSLPAGLQEFISDKDRVGWKYFIESDISGKVLDVGSGWGALAFSFAKNCEAVYALEPVWERVNFIRIRAEQDREGNLFPVCADALNLPFPDNYFDLVIFNGVLEWLGCSDLRLKPDIAQEKGLKEAQRVLRPGGSLYIGIENKLSFFYFLGVKDPHSRLRFATLMPKKIANLYSKLLKKKEYRTYIYSMPGYRELLSKSGFKSVSFFLPAPGYIKFKHIVALDKDRINDIDYFFRLINFRIIFSPALFRIFFVLVKMLFSPFLRNIFKLFVPDYLIIAKK